MVKGMKKINIEWVWACFMVLVILIAVFIEFWATRIPFGLYNRTGDSDIYQTLFMAQASMVAIVVAIISMSTIMTGTKLYGVALRKFAMEIQPWWPFRMKWVFVEMIVVIVLSWVFVALGLNNIAVGLFFVTVLLLVFFVIRTLSNLESSEKLEESIRNHILDSITSHKEDQAISVKTVFDNISENIKLGATITLERNLDFVKNYLLPKICSIGEQKYVDMLQDHILGSIKIIKLTNSSYATEIFELSVNVFEAINENNGTGRSNKKINLSKLADNWEFYELLTKLSYSALRDERHLLNRYQHHLTLERAMYSENIDDAGYSPKFPALSIAHRLRDNKNLSRNELEAAYTIVLAGVQRLYGFESYGQENIINFVVVLFKFREEYIVEALFGLRLDEPKWYNFRPIVRYSNFEMSKENIFFVLYTYYIGYRGGKSGDESEFGKKILAAIANRYWINLLRFVGDEGRYISFYSDFKKLLEKQKRWRNEGFGLRGSMGNTEYICRDFFLFSLASVVRNTDELEKIVRAILFEPSSSNYRHSYFGDFDYYVTRRGNAFELYKEFSEIMGTFNKKSENRMEEEYSRLQTVITNLYRHEKLNEAKKANDKFIPLQDSFRDSIFCGVSEMMDKFCSIFANTMYDENGESEDIQPDFTPHSMQMEDEIHFTSSNPNDVIDGMISNYSAIMQRYLYDIFVDKIKGNLNLLGVEGGFGKVPVSDFLNQINGIDPIVLIGVNRFGWDDPNYEKFRILGESCLEIWDASLLVAVDTKRINLIIKDLKVDVRKLTTEEIFEKIADSTSSYLYSFINPITDKTAAIDYLQNSRRVVEISFLVSFKCKDEFVGGGFIYENGDD
jgi:hypothetical protein